MENKDNKIVDFYIRWQNSPIAFIQDIWGLSMQPCKPEFVEKLKLEHPWNWKAEWFGDCINPEEEVEHRRWKWYSFEKGKHITWQQAAILVGIQRAIRYKKEDNTAMQELYRYKLSVRSGKGLGKTALVAWIVLWFLFCYKNSLIPCTAPTKETLEDALWREISLWIKKMPKWIEDKIIWQQDKVIIKEDPDNWYARAKTGKKENPEALAGMHADNMLVVADEASGVPREIFKNALDTLTNSSSIFLIISNPVRLDGTFYDTQNKDKKEWTRFAFNTEESPVVSEESLIEKIERNRSMGARKSDGYKTSVLGEFPSEDDADDEGYMRMFTPDMIKYSDETFNVMSRFYGEKHLGVDPSGSGTDTTAWVIRDNYSAKLLKEEQISTNKGIARQTTTFMQDYSISPRNVFIDCVGVGAGISKEIALSIRKGVNDVDVGKFDEECGDTTDDNNLFANSKAKFYWRLREWLVAGGTLSRSDRWNELLTIRYRVEENGKIKIMVKKEMRKKYGEKSPNIADALMLTFARPIRNNKISYKASYPLKPFDSTIGF